MSFTLNTKAEEAFNKSAYELIALIEESDIVDDHSIRELTGSLGEKPADDWSDISVDAPMTSQRTTNGIKIDIFELYKEKQIGLKEENYFKFKKLINNLYKIKTISDKVSTKFLHDNTFNWLLKTYKAKKADSDLITSLKEEAMSITKNYKFYFKILNLEIEKKFKIGNVEFEFIESDFFDTLETESSTSNELKEKYLGQVYCSFIAKDVEKSRGIEIALEECYKAMNVLKLFARTVFFPEHRTCYDIDTRVTVSEENEFIVRNLDESKHLNINKAAGATPFTLESTAIDAILVSSKRLEDLISNSEPNELQQM
ncbi:MAG: hypothetical protein Q8L81_16455, partial [Bacteroidota bacterium]|nr:hypothetical protein [Bacteroidota bacterium]